MNHKLFISCILMFLFVPIQGKDNDALIFDRFYNSIFDLPKNIPQDEKCGAWALACPAGSNAEKDFVVKYSFTDNALFVKEIYHRGAKASDVKENICEEPFKLSLAFHIRSSTFQFGFEIYYRLSDAKYFHDNITFDDYLSIEGMNVNLKPTKRKFRFMAGESVRIVKNAFDESSITELWLNEDRKLGFMWIQLVKFSFNSSGMILKKITYNISTKSRWPVEGERCEDYSLGDEIYDGLEVDKLYLKAGGMFDEFYWPPIPCPVHGECFKKVLLIPIDQFRFGSSTLLCSNLATIPVWTSTATERLLKKVDQFLYALHREIGKPLKVLAGIYDEHKFSIKGASKKSTLYLDLKDKKIPIPKIIYKIVEYRAESSLVEGISCRYSAVIVIHNDPLFKSSNRICSRTINKEWGFNKIFSGEEQKISETIYVCARNRNLMMKLFGFVKGSTEPATAPVLTLSEFPHLNYGGKDIRPEVNARFQKLINEGDNRSQEENKITELPANFDDPEDDTVLSSGDGKGTKEVNRKTR